MTDRLHIVLLEPYYGGSHAVFVDTFARRTRHRTTLATLPARKWKWRMRGAAMWFARAVPEWHRKDDPADLILCSDMLSVADLRALLPPPMRDVPIVCYFHENQLTYPLPAHERRDYHYGMTNITSCLAADAVWFNSMFHLNEFMAAARELLGKMPDFVPPGVMDEIRSKARVHPPPVSAPLVERIDPLPRDPPTILWCHRWEHDKNPEPFFEALVRLDELGCSFNLVLLGEQFRTSPPVFKSAERLLESHITHAGHLADRSQYLTMLAGCDLVVSTAIQENLGIAVLEAILAGCQPLLPDRLVYPEIVPTWLHGACLYADDAALLSRLRTLLNNEGWLSAEAMSGLQSSIDTRFGATGAMKRLDTGLEEVVISSRRTESR